MDTARIEKHHETLYSDRIGRLREELLASPFEADIERIRHVTRSYKATEGEGSAVRAAKALRETLLNMTIAIGPDDVLVGAKTKAKVAAPIGIERSTINRITAISMPFHGKSTDELAWLNTVGMNSPDWMSGWLNMPQSEIEEMNRDVLPYWHGRDAMSITRKRWEESGLAPTVATAADMQGHVTFGLKKVLDMGFDGIARQAKEALEKLDPSNPQFTARKDFLDGASIAAKAVGEFSQRYAELAEQLAEDADPARAGQLREIARRCRQVPANPARSFDEAVQATWMAQVVLGISYGEDAIFAPGRVDQYLYPYFQSDIAAGRINREEARELIDEYMIRLSTFTGFGPNNLTIGGMDRDGNCAVNEISYLFVDSLGRLKGMRNGLAVRVCEDSPRDFLESVCATHRRTAGIAFYNDNRAIADLMADGYSLEDARDYGVVGCAELTSCGNNNGYCSGSTCHFELNVELALNEGRAFKAKWQQIGVATPPAGAMSTFEDVKQAFRTQLANSVDTMVRLTDIKDAVFAEFCPTPLISSTIEGCIESGKDITQGGARYNHSTVSAQGLATVVNSLAAVQWAVFDRKLLTLEELVKHTHNNFKDAEHLRQQLIRKAPKYGNNDKQVDALAKWVVECLNEEAHKHRRPIDGGPYRALLISAGTQAMGGYALGATPDGRLAQEPVSNGVSPANGTDAQGATATLQSVARICSVPLSSGTSLNMNVNPITLQSTEGTEKFMALIEGYFALGGRQVQFNPMSRETLLDAQANPDHYPDLMVKVSGYSYRFVDLAKALQDDIIKRTELQM